MCVCSPLPLPRPPPPLLEDPAELVSTLAPVFYSWNKALNRGFQGILAHCGHESVGQRDWRQSWDLATSVASCVWRDHGCSCSFLCCEKPFLSQFLLRVRLGDGVKGQVGFVSQCPLGKRWHWAVGAGDIPVLECGSGQGHQ